MKPPFRSVFAGILFGCCLLAAPLTKQPADPSVYFYHTFLSLTDPDRAPQELSAFEADYAKMNHLNAADITTLRSKAEEFRTALVEIRAKSLEVASYDEDGQSTHALNVAFRREITDIGRRLVEELSSEAAESVRGVIGTTSSLAEEPSGTRGSSRIADAALPKLITHPTAHAYNCTGGGTSTTHPNCIPASLTSCIATSGTASAYNICTLAAGTYYVDGSVNYPVLIVTGSYVKVEGAAGNTSIIERCSQASSCSTANTSWPLCGPVSSQTGCIAQVAMNQQNVYFIGLTFNGNANTMGVNYKNPANHPNYYFELDLQQPGVYNTWVQNSQFNNSPQFSISTNYYSYIDSNQFNFVNNTTLNGDGAIRTYAAPGTSNSTDIEFKNNTVQNSGGGATALQGSQSVLIQGNFFYNSNYGCQFSLGAAVGVVPNPNTGVVPTNVEIISNLIWGPPMGQMVQGPSCSGGTELWGTNYTINTNDSEWNAGTGIFTWNVSGATMYGNIVKHNHQSGIEMADVPSGSCPPAANPLFTLNSNTIEYNNSYSIEGKQYTHCTAPNTYPNASDVVLGTGSNANTMLYNGNAALICPTTMQPSTNNQPCYHP